MQVGTIITVNYSDFTLFSVPNIVGSSQSSANDALVAAGARAIAVAFLFSFLDDRHEKRAR